jgi:hypothetical protein
LGLGKDSRSPAVRLLAEIGVFLLKGLQLAGENGVCIAAADDYFGGVNHCKTQNPNVTMKKVVLGLFSLALLSTACKKSKDAPAITKENLAGTYIITAATMKVGNSPEADMFSSIDDCQKDDQYKLNTDDTYNVIDAGTQCSPPGDYSDSWALSGNQITIDGEVGTITKFDGTNLEVTVEYTDSGMTFIIRTNYKKQ